MQTGPVVMQWGMRDNAKGGNARAMRGNVKGACGSDVGYVCNAAGAGGNAVRYVLSCSEVCAIMQRGPR